MEIVPDCWELWMAATTLVHECPKMIPKQKQSGKSLRSLNMLVYLSSFMELFKLQNLL